MNEQTKPKLDRRAYTIKQVCEESALCESTVYKHIRLGNLAARKCGRKTLVLVADLDRFLQTLPQILPREEAA